MSSPYEPVPVTAARAIATQFSKSQVIIIAWDQAHALVHTTTYGVSAEDKAHAARAGDICAKALGCDLSKKGEIREDFREAYDPALLAEARELLDALVRDCHPNSTVDDLTPTLGRPLATLAVRTIEFLARSRKLKGATNVQG